MLAHRPCSQNPYPHHAVRAAGGERASLLLGTGTTEPVTLGTQPNKLHQGRSGRADASIVIFVKW